MRRFMVVLLLIALFGFAIRVVYVLAVTRHEPIPALGVTVDGARRSFDEIYYVNGADALVHGDGFRFSELPGNPIGARAERAEHPPLTSIALAPVSALTDGDETAMRLWVAFAGGVLIVLVGFLGRALAGDRAGLLGAGLAAVYPGIWLNDGLLLSETYTMLFTVAAVLATYRLFRRPSWGWALAVGVACALAMLARAELALLVPVLAVAIALRTSVVPLSRRLGLAVVVVLVAALAVTPWVALNLSRFEKPVTLSHGAGGVISGANNDTTYEGRFVGFWNGLGGRATRARGDASVVADARLRAGLEYLGDHLDRVPAVVAFRVGRLWGFYRPLQMAWLDEADGRPKWGSLIATWMTPVLLVFGAWGLVVLVRRRVAIVPIVAPIALATLSGAVFYGSIRFRTIAEPSLVVLAAVGLDRLLARWSRSDDGAKMAS